MDLVFKVVKRASVLLVVLGIGFYLGLIANTTAAPSSQTTQKPPTRAELLKLVNAERAKVGVAPLKEDKRLDESAQFKADDMSINDYFGHESSKSPNDNGDSRQWLLESGIRCADTSENLAWNTDHSTISANQAVTWWIGSEPHHKAMIDPHYNLTGFGIVNDAVVEHFCQTP